MTQRDPRMKERLMELLVDQATIGLSDPERSELEALLREHPELDPLGIEAAAAALAIGLTAGAPGTDAMPAELRARIAAQGSDAIRAAARSSGPAPTIRPDAFARQPDRPTSIHPQPSAPAAAGGRGPSFIIWGGWLTAAAGLILAAVAWLQSSGGPPRPPSPAAIRRVVDSAPDSVTRDWGVWPRSDTGESVSGLEAITGKVVWNQTLQQGYMVFRGMPKNAAVQRQYQLWIIDKTQKNPIDGGVFDISGDGEVIVPIDAKIAVKEPIGFGVTEEPAGGVVVSDQTRRIVVALLGP